VVIVTLRGEVLDHCRQQTKNNGLKLLFVETTREHGQLCRRRNMNGTERGEVFGVVGVTAGMSQELGG